MNLENKNKIFNKIKEIPRISNIMTQNQALELVQDWNAEMKSLKNNDIQGIKNANYKIETELYGSGGKSASPLFVTIDKNLNIPLVHYIEKKSVQNNNKNTENIFSAFLKNFDDLSEKANSFIEKDEIKIRSQNKKGVLEPISNDVSEETMNNLRKSYENREINKGKPRDVNWSNSPHNFDSIINYDNSSYKESKVRFAENKEKLPDISNSVEKIGQKMSESLKNTNKQSEKNQNKLPHIHSNSNNKHSRF